MAELDVKRFLTRLNKLQSHFLKHNATVWNKADCVVLHRGPLDDDQPYLKSVTLHQWLFGYELPDTILLLTKDGNVWLLATQKKLDFVRPALEALPELKTGKSKLQDIHLLLRNKQDGNEANYASLWKEAGLNVDGGEKNTKRVVGVILKERAGNSQAGGILGPWEEKLTAGQENGVELVDVSAALSFLTSVKDESELDLLKKSSVLANKVMKHGYVKRMEEIIDSETSITHEALAKYVDEILEDPTKINLKVPPEDVQACYFPIVQSGGAYDLKVSAQSSAEKLKHDVILVSIGARYKSYCSNMSRTFLVDPPKKVSETYDVLLEVQEACLEVMKVGRQLKDVYETAIAYLEGKPGSEYLVAHLPKNLGFATGLDFRDNAFLLTPKNTASFKVGMVFCLSIGFQNLTLSESDRASTPDKSQQLSTYALVVSDMVSVTTNTADVMTKMGKNLTDVAYNINEDADEDDEDDDDDGEESSSRLAKDAAAMQDANEGVVERERRQISLMTRRNEERLRELARANRKKGDNDENDEVEELESYKRTRDYPDNVQPNQVKVDMASKCVVLPICGNPVPFHISTIKNVVMPDADNATLLRINFYTAGMAVGKDAPENMVKLVQKYAPYASFVREMTFRSLDGHNLTLAFRQISELRKRERQKELLQQEEATLVKQEKLIRTKNERVPRLADLTMRPVFAGRKTQGNLEAHSNGLRFISTRSEIVDIMYNNIKYAIYQPCEGDIMVLIHFHLKNPIMVGKKKHLDIQFFTEVIEASQAVDNARRSMYDPDEMDDEQRERQLRKKLNQAFKEFCKKVDIVAKKNGHELEFDIPYRDLGFTGNPHKEMVNIVPTLNCLVNLTETPFFVVDLEHVDHVHFERVTYMSKAFDMVLVNKDFSKQPWRIDMIPNGDKDAIQEWLTDMEITYTEGPMNLNWKQITATVKDDDRFYMNTEEDEVTEKEAGWEFLRMFGREDEEDEDPDEDDSEFGDDRVESEASDEEEEVDEFVSDDDDDEEDFDADEDLEEEGLDWDEMEAAAAADDRRKRNRDEDLDPEPARKQNQSSKRRR
ncbi:predicted protein [Phaeodactylum tricornutum CCAP 1055/1]|uniref:FACT complex subunit n=5 Tax=Phaeodactylum tricornutum TaxID=2850 RepID=B7FSR1_PHATC|nr:predicted protein [Phaeodactylum tricornutum CCAP 1055/1]EEC50840.1 predicted protein [Phaeodactylum tricornutum CCAP 1055/1]|eukprot:XP_002178026.1 predicted protein [Phaeodactylum tricornutum CCAP 1055/1]